MSSRSSRLNSPLLLWLMSTATTTSSKSPAARPMMSRCPFVTGSKEPGQTARLMIGDRTKATLASRARAEIDLPRSHVVGACVPEHRLAVPAAAQGRVAGRPANLGPARRSLDHDDRARGEPALGQRGEQLGDSLAGHVVGR